MQSDTTHYRSIYLYHVENEELSGITEVTAAHEMLHAAWIRLDEREKEVVRKFYGLGIHHETLAEIADDMSLKRERVRQIRDKAIRKISKNASSKVLKHFLRK